MLKAEPECGGEGTSQSCGDLEVEGHTIEFNQKLGTSNTQDYHTFAISSLFLNSPLTRTTLPFSSNSVHRSLASFADLGDMLRPRLKAGASPPSSKKEPSGRSSDFSGRGIFCLRPHNWRSHPPLLLDTCHPLPPLDACRCEVCNKLIRDLPRLVLWLGRICFVVVAVQGHKKSRLRKPASRV